MTTNDAIHPTPHAALMVLRVSIERGSTHPLRAQVRETTDVTHGFERSFLFTDVDSTMTSVREWLEALLEAEAPSQPSSAGEPPVEEQLEPS